MPGMHVVRGSVRFTSRLPQYLWRAARISRARDIHSAAFRAHSFSNRGSVWGGSPRSAGRWMGYVLIGTEASQFSGKARAFLRWKGVDFAERQATPEAYRDIIEPRIGFPVIPILLTPDNRIVQDTADIVDDVEQARGGPSVYPDGPVQRLVSLLIELYADEWLIIAATHYRWAYNEDWILEEMGAVAAPDASKDEKLKLGRIAAERVLQLVPKLGVSEETGSGIEAHYEGFLADLSAHLRRMPFLLGARPSFGDFALFGPLYGPLYRDPASGALMKRLSPDVASWVELMNGMAPKTGDLLPGDQIPETLRPILKRQMAEQLPVLVDSLAKLGEWAEAQPQGARLSRTLGQHEFTIGGRRGERAVFASSLWRLQRVLDHYRALGDAERTRAAQLLSAVGGSALTEITMPRRLERRDFKLVLA